MSFLLEEDRPRRKTREEALAETPAELQSEMTNRLNSPDLLKWIVEGIELFGVAGEHLLALTIYLTGTSRLLPKPLAAIVQGASSSGKSYVIEKIAELFPGEAVLSATDLTPNALYYLPAGELEHRFVVAGERPRRQSDETAQGTKSLREMISSGLLRKVLTIADPSGPQSKQVEQQGPIAYVESTTEPQIFEEDANRCLILQPDEGPEQTRLILMASGRRLTGCADGRDQLRQQFHCLHRLLQPLPVVIPFSETLSRLFPNEPLEVRRAFGHVTSMTQTCALLHQFQRDRDDLGRIIARPEDYWLTRCLLKEVMAHTLGKKAGKALGQFVTRLRTNTGEQTVKSLASATMISERRVREHLETLLAQGLVEQISEGRGRIPAKWNILEGVELSDPGDELLPTVEAVFGVSEDSLQLSEMPSNWTSADLCSVPF